MKELNKMKITTKLKDRYKNATNYSAYVATWLPRLIRPTYEKILINPSKICLICLTICRQQQNFSLIVNANLHIKRTTVKPTTY